MRRRRIRSVFFGRSSRSPVRRGGVDKKKRNKTTDGSRREDNFDGKETNWAMTSIMFWYFFVFKMAGGHFLHFTSFRNGTAAAVATFLSFSLNKKKEIN